MSRFDDLLSRLNASPMKQRYLDWAVNIPAKIWYDFFVDTEWGIVDTNLNVDKRRWYEISTTVVKIFGRYLSIRQVSQIYTETMDAGDVGHSPTYKEVFPVVVGGVEYV